MSDFPSLNCTFWFPPNRPPEAPGSPSPTGTPPLADPPPSTFIVLSIFYSGFFYCFADFFIFIECCLRLQLCERVSSRQKWQMRSFLFEFCCCFFRIFIIQSHEWVVLVKGMCMCTRVKVHIKQHCTMSDTHNTHAKPQYLSFSHTHLHSCLVSS